MKVLISVIMVSFIMVVAAPYYDIALCENMARKTVMISDLHGMVEVKSASADKWIPARWGMRIGEGDTIRTKKGSYADLSFEGKIPLAAIMINEDTMVTINTFLNRSRIRDVKIILDLYAGKVLVTFNNLKDASQFKINTPTSVAAIKGTGVKVSVYED